MRYTASDRDSRSQLVQYNTNVTRPKLVATPKLVFTWVSGNVSLVSSPVLPYPALLLAVTRRDLRASSSCTFFHAQKNTLVNVGEEREVE